MVDRLWQLYRHDLSEFRGYMPDSEGLYEPGRLPTFFEDPDRCGYLIYSGQVPAGFALIRDPGGLFGFYAARPSSRRARWLVRRRSSGVPVQ